jgi:hypothetical protein
MNIFRSLGLLAILTSSFAVAASTPPPASQPISVREMAEREAQGRPEKSVNTITPTTAALSSDGASSSLQLKDGFVPISTRKFLWTFGFSVTSFESYGKESLSNQVVQDLGREERTSLYSVNFGYLSDPQETQQFGLEAELGTGYQRVALTGLESTTTEARLNTILSEVRGLTRWGESTNARWHYRVGVGAGRLQQTQTSAFSQAGFSRENYYASALGGIDYRLSKTWIANFNYRLLSFPTSQFGLGVQTLW